MGNFNMQNIQEVPKRLNIVYTIEWRYYFNGEL